MERAKAGRIARPGAKLRVRLAHKDESGAGSYTIKGLSPDEYIPAVWPEMN